MSAQSFKQRLSRCKSQPEIERLLQDWHAIRATHQEYQELRERVIERIEQVN